MRRRWVVSLGLLAGLLAGCPNGSSGRTATSATRHGGAQGSTTSTAPPPPSALRAAFFDSPQDGWALADEPCPPPRAEARCAVVWKTGDGATSWTHLGGLDVPADGAGGPDFVSTVYYADGQHGWAFNRSLFATFNGGRRWQRVDLGNPVVALESVGSQAYALVGACDDRAGNCTGPMRLAEGTIATGRWRFVGLGFDLPSTAAGTLIVNRSDVYALVRGSGADQVFLGRTGAGRWERRTSPCPRALVEPITGEDGLVAACLPALPGGPTELQTSSDGGRSWAVVWQYTFPSPLASLAVTGEAAVVALENGDVLRTTDNGMTFATVVRAGANPAVKFSDADHGIVTGGATGRRQLFRTTDNGATWPPVKAPD